MVSQDMKSTYSASNVQYVVCNELGICIINAFFAYAEIMEDNELIFIPENIDIDEAKTIFENVNNLEIRPLEISFVKLAF